MRRRRRHNGKKPEGGELRKWRGCEKREKPKAGFPLFPRAPWKSRQQQARFPHFHSSGECCLSQTEQQARKESGSVGDPSRAVFGGESGDSYKEVRRRRSAPAGQEVIVVDPEK